MEFDEYNIFKSEDDDFLRKIDEDLDFALALSLQEDLNNSSKTVATSKPKNLTATTSGSNSIGIVDPQWELIDPNPNIHALFLEFNACFFDGKLAGVEVKWSPRMTLCAGVCSYEGRGGLCSVRLSAPLLKLRPRRDLVETLLHEMIHAYLFVTANNKDHDAHGPEFLSHMNRINKETGTRISVYHSFHDEVDMYRTHWWKCNGPCQKRRPFFGLVKRAMNRVPGPLDNWWAQHQVTCGGSFVKIKEPNNYKAKNKSSKRKQPSNSQDAKPMNGIKSFFDQQSKGRSEKGIASSSKKTKETNGVAIKSGFESDTSIISSSYSECPSQNTVLQTPFSGQGQKLGSSSFQKTNSFLHSLHLERAKSKNLPNSSKASNIASKNFSKNSINANGPSKHSSVVSKTPETPKLRQISMNKFVTSPKHPVNSPEVINLEETKSYVDCPVCTNSFLEAEINKHLDRCLSS